MRFLRKTCLGLIIFLVSYFMQFSTIFRPNLSIHTCPDLIRSFLPLSGHCRLLHASQGQLSVYQDSYLKALDRKKRSRSLKSKEFDTLGTWDTRPNVQIDEDATFKTGHVVLPVSLASCTWLSLMVMDVTNVPNTARTTSRGPSCTTWTGRSKQM